LLLHTSYLPLGVPNGLVNHHAQGRLLHIHITVSSGDARAVVEEGPAGPVAKVVAVGGTGVVGGTGAEAEPCRKPGVAG
jgi:hypothetical protein